MSSDKQRDALVQRRQGRLSPGEVRKEYREFLERVPRRRAETSSTSSSTSP
jgi:hypothetical protein